MKRILLSIMTIALVSGAAFGATRAFFTDEEKSTGNTFSTGTIDIAVDGQNPWSRTTPYQFADMKPGQVEYSNFRINNVGTNPVNIFKKIANVVTEGVVISEPECVENGGTWSGQSCTGNYVEKSDIDTAIEYDLSVKVYNSSQTEIFNQVLYDKDVTVGEIKGSDMFLGMIPVGGYMDVTESYHMKDGITNWAQGDKMTFDIVLTGEQLKGTLVLEDKDPADWDINQVSLPKGTLTYGVKDSKFNYSFTGVVPLANTGYSLIAYHEPWSTPSGSGWPRPVTVLGSATSDSSGNISIPSTSVELGMNLLNMKIWLVKTSDLSGSTLNVWSPSDYLFETGLIDYYDADL